MPSSVSSSLLVFGAVLTSVSAEWGSIVAGVGVLVELTFFVRAGLS